MVASCSSIQGRIALGASTDEAYRTLHARRYADEVMRWADDSNDALSLEDFLERRRERFADPSCLERVILVDGEPAGTITAFGLNRFSRDCELGIVLVDPARWGRGIGSAAICLFLVELRCLGVLAVHLETFADNLRAQAAFAKVGFTESLRYFDLDARRDIVGMTLSLVEREAVLLSGAARHTGTELVSRDLDLSVV